MANILRVSIDERWTASEFAELMSQLQFVADAALFSEVKLDGQSSTYFPFRRIRRRMAYYDPFLDVEDELRQDAYFRRVETQEILKAYSPRISNELKIKRIEYGSPGFADLTGIGKVVEQVRIFTTAIIDRYLHREDREIVRESAAQDLLSKKIKNAEALLNLGDKVGLDGESKRMLISEVLNADYFIEGKIIDGKIKSIDSPAE
jgi:hypothetical protein